ncbi:helix-turn-helix domain-containing protein [Feifania hominis]|uniref:Helix-turn-helix domain-containing protein n=1 Tax=Feifania hominis TaxID=2763660 RepID=A0A926DD99_9FIRM|nr:helix-turn-helix domain-containing protein [Feifania hominis]MBC8535993.1 helix-turn-helix domain-containing protein [Feifania hominis]
MKDVLKEITRLRLERGWTEYELAKRSGLSQSTISTWYRKDQIPTIQSLEKICNGFGLTLSQFFAENQDAVSLTSEQKDMLDNWSALSAAQKRIIKDLLKNLDTTAAPIHSK